MHTLLTAQDVGTEADLHMPILAYR